MRARIANHSTIHGISRLTENYILRASSAYNSDLTGQKVGFKDFPSVWKAD